MPISRRIAALIVAAVLGVPAAAAAQTTTIPRGGADVSNTPPVPLAGPKASSATTAASSLPNTGSDPRLLFACGIALTLIGVGLRLRTADAELY
ncbi:MAG TPA: hypothetical protein VL120_19140 [Solirubrobacteraceae bacterium]|nr:hypothetical protein [Solirubrobacteraceae bacterium]